MHVVLQPACMHVLPQRTINLTLIELLVFFWFAGSIQWEHQNGSSAFVIAEPRALQHQQFPTLKRTVQPPTAEAELEEGPSHQQSTNSVNTLAPSVQQSPARNDGTLKASPRGSGDGEEPAQVIKTNGLTPRPLPPNMPVVNGGDDSPKHVSVKFSFYS